MKKSKNIFISVFIILLVGMTSIYAEYLEEGVEVIQEPETVEYNNIQFSMEFKQKLELQGMLEKYKEFLVNMNVQTPYQKDLEQIILQGTNASDLMIAYEYLQADYAPKAQLNVLLKMKKEGMAWNKVFTNYSNQQPKFIPTNFEQKYLQDLISVGSVTRDDIMIADHIAHSAQVKPQEVIEKRIGGMSFKEISLFYDLLGSKAELSRVSISLETLNRYLDSGYDEEYIAESFVLAERVNQSIETVVLRQERGITDEMLIEAYLTNKYK